MIVENSQDNITIDVPESYKNIGFKLSGGADSAIVLYMLSKYITETGRNCKIIPITICHAGKAFQLQYACKIIFFMEETFGVKFGKHFTGVNHHASSYTTVQDNIVANCYRNEEIDCHFSGITANPPKEVMESFNTAGPQDDRNRLTDKKPQIGGGTIFFPLINIDKQGVRELYEKYNLMDTLFPLTRSCEAFTDDFSKHCGEYRDEISVCWFCKERLWGFGRYI